MEASEQTAAQPTPAHSKSFGVFKPTGHVVVSFPAETDLDAVERALASKGFAADAVSRISAEQMVAQADADIDNASMLASIGQELNLVKAQRELALRGQSFVVVAASNDALSGAVAEVARQFNASRAQHYGRFLVEELIEVGSSNQQVSESPDRGLDAQTRSGHEQGG